ncbi:hypothetical protein D0469_09270 [Peribacillus saganii]|uniref:Uncharacterized protein n=1 Tax=Peribacillus saganii TaxID=2303992 RepID=A0A372LP65_9BACI|nr:hypothetical protein [Peribacillus saganii]RFU69545.1 hypothetical protein D0469_09270 [Peribacillus saganii]
MHWKKYLILLPPFILIVVLLEIYLPSGVTQYAIGIVLLFWAVYYTWIYVEKKRKKDNHDKSISEGIKNK